MKYVSVITDYTYLLWQQELQAFNFKKLGMIDDLAVVVLKEPGKELSEHAKRVAEMCEVHVFDNTQTRRHYIPSNKPFGLMKLLEANPEYGTRLFLLDSDVIFRERLDFSKLDGDDFWYVSDTIGYIGYHYLKNHLTDEEIAEMGSIVGVQLDQLKDENLNSGGAQYYMKGVDAEFCRKVTEDSINLYDWALKQKRDNGTFKIQVWTAEMWAWLWNAFLRAEVRVSREMDFSWAPHHISDWEKKKMLHLAGVTSAANGAFFKGKYTHTVPWVAEKSFEHVDKTKCWWPYVQLIQEYKETIDAS